MLTALRGRVRVPGDKSLAHRALIFAGLSPVPVTIHGLPTGQSVACTRRAMEALGAWVEDRGDGVVRVEGVGAPGIGEAEQVIHCGGSATTLRLLAGVAATRPHLTILTGDTYLRRRPMERIVEPLRRMGATVMARGGDRLPPLAIRGGELTGVCHEMPVASAQLKSCLLLAGLGASGTLELREPGPSRDHTERILEWWGVELERGSNTIKMACGQPLIPATAEPDIRLPGDLSSAAFLAVAAAITPGSDLVIEGVGVNPTRTGILDVLVEMGVRLDVVPLEESAGEPVADIRVRGPQRLTPFTLGGDRLVRAIDEVPALAIAAIVAQGTSTILDAGELRHKESDRLSAVARGLTTLGARVDEQPDGLTIHGGERLRGGHVDAGGDHRMAMAFAIATLAADGPIQVNGADAAAVSWPGFYQQLEQLVTRGERS